jgi:hypothetical protein
MKEGYSRRAMQEGFAASSGVSNETAESGGRVPASEEGDESITARVTSPNAHENAGLADN